MSSAPRWRAAAGMSGRCIVHRVGYIACLRRAPAALWLSVFLALVAAGAGLETVRTGLTTISNELVRSPALDPDTGIVVAIVPAETDLRPRPAGPASKANPAPDEPAIGRDSAASDIGPPAGTPLHGSDRSPPRRLAPYAAYPRAPPG
jgi:hypothetical protein